MKEAESENNKSPASIADKIAQLRGIKAYFQRDGLDSTYRRISTFAALTIVPLTFFGSWIYCAVTYGFLLGGGLGWIPSAIVAVIAGCLGYFIWPLIILAIAASGMFLFQS